jgi:hypothetical protein
MATNLALDDDLISQAQKVGHHKTKKEATAVLKEYIALKNSPREEALMSTASKLLIGLLLLFFFQNSVHATPLIDQEQPVIDTSVGGLTIGGGSQQILAQVVTTGLSGILTEVRFPVACVAGDLVVEIQGVVPDAQGGRPNGVVLTSQIIPGTSLPPFFPSPGFATLRSLVFSEPVSFSAGSHFAIVLSSAGQCGVFQGPIGDSYSGGNEFFDARPNPVGVWVCICNFAGHRFDLPFQTLVEPTLQVNIDIKPGGFPNSVNPGSSGVIPVAILTTAIFDATTVDPATVRFGATGTEAAPRQSALEDVDGDGDIDLILHFRTQTTEIQCGDAVASLTGETFSSQMIQGSDSISTVGCK